MTYTAAHEGMNDLLDLVLQATSTGLWRWDMATDQVWWSPEAWRIHGLQPPQFDGTRQAFFARVHPEDRERVSQEMQAAAREHRLYSEQCRIVRPDGSVRWVSHRGRAAYAAAGQPVAVLGTITDVTDAQMQLAAANARLREATRAGGLGIHEYDPVHDRLVWDAQMRQWWGLAPDEEPTYETFVDRVHPDDRKSMQEAVNRALDPAGDGRYDARYRVMHPDGSTRMMRATGLVSFDAGRAVRLLGTVQDISRDHALSQALQQADRRKDVFLATLSHELRNPLAPIQVAAQLLGHPHLGDDKAAWARSVIQRQVRHIALLLDDLLDVARISQGKLGLNFQDVELQKLIEASVETARPLLDRSGHRLVVDAPCEPVTVCVDPLRLAQVLSNLLNNAAKYTDPGGRIELRARLAHDALVVTVADDGIGIAADVMPRLFEIFAQHDGAASRADGGLGIGLALAKGLTELHGGTIQGHSDGPGRGSTFTVRLPGVQRSQAAGAPPDTSPPPQPMRLLVVDDNVDGADALAMLLSLDGHEVRQAYDGAAGLSLARAFRPQAAIVDIDLPGMDGHQLAQRLRSEPWAAGLMLIALTGYGQESDRRATAASGFDHHLTKPVDIAALQSLLRPRA